MRALTLYAGAGGVDLGLRQAGIEHVACVEVDADCIATLTAAGFPAVRAGIGGPYEVRRGKTQRLVETVPAFDPAPYVGVDLVWASPPCQPYSRAGKGLGAADPRDGWPATVEVLRVVKPTWAVIENVGGAPVAEWTVDLEGLGYVVSARTIDCADLGVPQNRVREIIVAGPAPMPWPRPTHYGPKVPPFVRIGRVPWVSMGEALPHLVAWGTATNASSGMVGVPRSMDTPSASPVAGGHALGGLLGWVRTEQITAVARPVTDPAPAVSGAGAGNAYLHDRDVGVCTRRVPSAISPSICPAPTMRAQGSTDRTGHQGGCAAPLVYAPGQGRAATEPTRLDSPAPTVTTTEEKGTRASAASDFDFNGGPDRASDAAFLATGRRRLTWEECAVLQSFPPCHPFAGTKTSKYRQIGNAVPPPLALAIGLALATQARP